VGDASPAVAATARAFVLPYFLVSVAGLGPLLAGVLLFVARAWDALTDPLMGWLIDRTTSRFGRLRPWLLFGALPFGGSFALLWLVPPLDTPGRFLYYLLVLVLYSTATTMVSVPHTALTTELSRDYDERTTLTAFRFGFGASSGLVGGLSFIALTMLFCSDPQQCAPAERQPGFLLAALVIGALLVLPPLLCFAGVRERARPVPHIPLRALLPRIREVLQNRVYLLVLGLQVCALLAAQITAALLPFYLDYWFGRGDLFLPMFLLVQLSTLASLALGTYAAHRLGKRAVYIGGMLLWIGVQVSLFGLQPQQVTAGLVLAALAGPGLAVASLVPWSMLADVIEVDELQSGQRREGLCYGLAVLGQKLGTGLGLFLMGAILSWQGFDEALAPGEQPASALLALRLLLGPIPALLLVVGIVLVWFYPLSRERHAAVRAQLAARAAAQEPPA
jgi:GPH family glycoside/pentoside/hexuronide:cation symporter